MRVSVFPRVDRNPNQSLPYREMERLGVRVSYLDLGRITPSRTLNLLVPLEAARRDATGLPREAIVSYDGAMEAPTSALTAREEGSTLANMTAAAHAYAAELPWYEIAARTKSEMDAVC